MNLHFKQVWRIPGDASCLATGLITIKADGYREQWSFRGFPEAFLRQVFNAMPAEEKYLEVIWHEGINNSQLEAIIESYPKGCQIKEIPAGMVIRCDTSCAYLYFSKG